MQAKPNVVAIHGIRDDGNQGLDPLCRNVAKQLGANFREPKMPVRKGWQCYDEDINMDDANLCAAYIDSLSIVIAHSRGCLVADRIMKSGRRLGTVVFLAPALPSDQLPGAGNFENMLIVYNDDDKALLAARFLPFHPFTGRRCFALGRSMLGRVGYNGPERVISRMSQWDGKNMAGIGDTWLDHSNFWTSGKAIDAMGQKLTRWIRGKAQA